MTEIKSDSIMWSLASSTPEERLGRLSWLADTRHDMTEQLSGILLGEKVAYNIVEIESGDILVPAWRKLTKTVLRGLVKQYLDHALANQALIPVYSQFGPEGPYLSPWHFQGAPPINKRVFTLLYERLVRSE